MAAFAMLLPQSRSLDLFPQSRRRAPLTMASNSTSACAICSKPASNRCSGCKINTYCGRDCQTSDWVKHKAICKIWQIENLLRRVTAITHETYLLFRENTWSSPVTSIEGHGTKDIVFTQVAKHMLRKKYFSEFPHKLTKDEQTKASVLTMGASNEPLGFMCDNLHELLKGELICSTHAVCADRSTRSTCPGRGSQSRSSAGPSQDDNCVSPQWSSCPQLAKLLS